MSTDKALGNICDLSWGTNVVALLYEGFRDRLALEYTVTAV